jgi:hypothetical protein
MALLLAALVLSTGSCTRLPAPPDLGEADARFSGDQALGHLEALAGLGARPPGSRSDRVARSYLRRELRRLGASVGELADGERRHLVAEIPGGSSDVILLAAPLQTLPRWGPIDDSGVVVLLELARVLSLAEQPYTLRLVFAEVRELPPEESAIPPTSPTPLADPRSLVVAAGDSLVRALEGGPGIEDLRLVVVFDSLGRVRLRVAQDLRSHPVFRDFFWRSASALGFESVFPSDAKWSSPRSLHLGFREAGLTRVVALVDESLARPDLDGIPSRRGNSASVLEIVGTVSVEALGRTMQRLEKIDGLSTGS